MHIAFIADPLATFKIYKDSTYAMMVEADRRGHTLAYIDQRDLARAANGVVEAKAWPLALTGRCRHLARARRARDRRAEATSTRWSCARTRRSTWSTSTRRTCCSTPKPQGAKVFNGGRAIRDHNEKFAIAEFPELIAPTLVTRDGERIREFHREHRDIILKPLDGMGGMGIFRVTADGMNLGSMIEMLGGDGERTIMAQKYIPAIVDGDKRILVIDGEPVPYALARIPQGGEVRGNLAAGGRGRAQPLSARDREIGEIVGAKLAKRGLLLIGVDSIGDYLTEVNVTSPTCFAEIFQGVGFDVAAVFVDALERAVAAAPRVG